MLLAATAESLYLQSTEIMTFVSRYDRMFARCQS